MDRVARVVMLGCCVAALGACGTGATAAPVTTTSPSVTLAPSTTPPPSTTSAPTTTLSPREQDEAEIREIHDRFFALMGPGAPNPDNPEYPAVTTGIELQRSLDYDRTAAGEGQHYGGSIKGRLLTQEFADSEHATVTVCTDPDESLIAQDGSVLARDTRPPFITSLQMLRTADGWRVSDWLTGGHERCDF